jgi:hypothetical protein
MQITAAGGTTLNLSGLTFNSYGADGTTSAALRFTATTGTITVNIINGGNTPTYKTLGATITIQNSKTLTITIVDANNNPIVGDGSTTGARVAVYKASDNSTIIAPTFTNASGVVTGVFAYVSDTPIVVRVRLSPTGTTRYLPVDSRGTITTNGYSASISMIREIIAV